jgi:hypothetical protein
LRGLALGANAADGGAETAADDAAEGAEAAAAAGVVILRDNIGEQHKISSADLTAADIGLTLQLAAAGQFAFTHRRIKASAALNNGEACRLLNHDAQQSRGWVQAVAGPAGAVAILN